MPANTYLITTVMNVRTAGESLSALLAELSEVASQQDWDRIANLALRAQRVGDDLTRDLSLVFGQASQISARSFDEHQDLTR